MYIHGGRDIKEGQMSNMWKLSLPGVEELANDNNFGVQWEPVRDKGTSPGKISHHKAIVLPSMTDVMIIGGMTGINEITEAYNFDTNKDFWTKLVQVGDVPQPRDDHSLVLVDEMGFLIFGGFVNGSRTNDVFMASRSGPKLIWT
jgi:hypothetical protein